MTERIWILKVLKINPIAYYINCIFEIIKVFVNVFDSFFFVVTWLFFESNVFRNDKHFGCIPIKKWKKYIVFLITFMTFFLIDFMITKLSSWHVFLFQIQDKQTYSQMVCATFFDHEYVLELFLLINYFCRIKH